MSVNYVITTHWIRCGLVLFTQSWVEGRAGSLTADRLLVWWWCWWWKQLARIRDDIDLPSTPLEPIKLNLSNGTTVDLRLFGCPLLIIIIKFAVWWETLEADFLYAFLVIINRLIISVDLPLRTKHGQRVQIKSAVIDFYFLNLAITADGLHQPPPP